MKKQVVKKKSGARKYPDGMTPVRHPDIPPTDTKKTEPSDVNTGASSPQVGHLVWKDAAWQGGFRLLLLLAIIGFLFILIGLKQPVEILALAGGAAGLIVFLGFQFG